MDIVPLSAVPSQRLAITLAEQSCRISVYEGRSYDVQRPVLGFGFLPGQPLGTLDLGGGVALDLGETLPLIRTTASALYLDLAVDGRPVVSGAPCLDGVRLIRNPYLGFVGDLMFVDTRGSTDPQVAGLGTRWLLAFLAA